MDHVKKRIDEFLQHPQKKILVLKGKWGVGKTRFWNRYIEKKDFTEITEQKYSYVSLFGVSSIQEVEDLIFSKTIALDGCSRIRDLSQKAMDKFSWVQSLPKIKDFAEIAKRISRIFIKEYLVCLDDLERRDPALTMGALLGFVSQLKEENSCRIVLIFNHEKLEDNSAKTKSDSPSSSKEELDRYYEKVIDETISYDPSIESNVSVIFTDDKEYAIASPVFEQLGLKNIRIMQQAKWNIDDLNCFIEPLEEMVQKRIKKNIIMLTCFRYDPNLGVDVEKFADIDLAEYWFQAVDDENVQSEIKLHEQYDYQMAKYDCYIIRYISDGICDFDAFKEQLERLDKQEKHSQIISRYDKLWWMYNGNFQASKEDVCSAVNLFLDDCAEELSYEHLKGICDLIEIVNCEINIAKLKDHFVTTRIEIDSIEGLSHLQKLTVNTELLDRISQRMQSLKSEVTIEELIDSVVGTPGWSAEVVERLNSFSEQEFKEVLITSQNETLLRSINRLLSNWQQSGEGEKAVVKKIQNALDTIGAMSSINHKRVKMVTPTELKNNAE